MWKLSKRGPFDVFTNLVYCLILIIHVHATHVEALLQTYTLYQQVSNAKHVYPFKRPCDLLLHYQRDNYRRCLNYLSWNGQMNSYLIIQQHLFPLFLLLCWTYAIKIIWTNVYLVFSFVLNSINITGRLNII